jgi:hypothetical protein
MPYKDREKRLSYLKQYRKDNLLPSRTIYMREYRRRNKEHINDWYSRRRAELKKLLFARLGNVCKHCGFKDVRALQIDHIHGGGKKDIGKGYGYKRFIKLLALINLEELYQLLCANCNWIKSYESGERRIRIMKFQIGTSRGPSERHT